MRIPFKVTAKGVKDKNKSGSEQFGFIIFVKHTKNNTLDSLKKKGKELSIFKKETLEFRINSKNTVTMLDID